MFYNLVIVAVFVIFLVGCALTAIRYVIAETSPRTPVLFLQRLNNLVWLLAMSILVIYIVLWVLGITIR